MVEANKGERPFAVFDIDGTLIRWQLYHAIADALARRGNIKPEVYQRIRDARLRWKRRSDESSFKDYERQLILIYEEVLEKLSVDEFNEAVEAVYEEYKDQVYTFTRELISRLKKKGYFLLAISGSQSEIVAKIADYYKFDDYVGTIYEYAEGRFTGKKVIASKNKAKTLRLLIKKHHLSLKGSVAVGDSASDASMLELVELPIAFNPDAELFDEAKEKGWKVVLERKNMIYELEFRDGKYILAKTNA